MQCLIFSSRIFVFQNKLFQRLWKCFRENLVMLTILINHFSRILMSQKYCTGKWIIKFQEKGFFLENQYLKLCLFRVIFNEINMIRSTFIRYIKTLNSTHMLRIGCMQSFFSCDQVIIIIFALFNPKISENRLVKRYFRFTVNKRLNIIGVILVVKN